MIFLRLLIPFLFCAACVVGGYLWHIGDVARGTAAVPVGDVSIGGPFRLVDQDGKPRSDSDFRGRYMLVFFGYTNCPDVCPTTLAMLTDAFDQLGGKADRIVPIFVTVDPERDTAEVLKTYLAAFGPRFVGLTGSVADVTAAAKAYHVYIKKNPIPGGYSMDHSSVIYLMGPDGRFVTNYSIEQGPDAVAADLRKRV